MRRMLMMLWWSFTQLHLQDNIRPPSRNGRCQHWWLLLLMMKVCTVSPHSAHLIPLLVEIGAAKILSAALASKVRLMWPPPPPPLLQYYIFIWRNQIWIHIFFESVEDKQVVDGYLRSAKCAAFWARCQNSALYGKDWRSQWCRDNLITLLLLLLPSVAMHSNSDSPHNSTELSERTQSLGN